jgi:hypothetical protein
MNRSTLEWRLAPGDDPPDGRHKSDEPHKQNVPASDGVVLFDHRGEEIMIRRRIGFVRRKRQ